MSSSHNNSTSSSSTQSSLPAGATTGANNPNREETAVTSTQQPNTVADPLHCHHYDPDGEVVALRPRHFLEAGTCELCGEPFTRERIRDLTGEDGRHHPHAGVVALCPQTSTETLIYVCDVCGLGFTSQENRKLHRREHFSSYRRQN